MGSGGAVGNFLAGLIMVAIAAVIFKPGSSAGTTIGSTGNAIATSLKAAEAG